MRAAPLPQRVDGILLLRLFKRNNLLTYKFYLRLMGMLAAAAAVIPLGLLSLRPFQVWVNGLHLDPKWHRNRKINEEFRRITTVNLETTFMAKLDQYTPEIMSVVSSRGGAA
ncbi:hypothetical protein SKAU_G00020530 [Synaphobranchus kaupii]|uniref:Uncharacterized protein n=1 Tax=Synaphobranchus kaupii TaxID=118154 RepID=A0A9Q1GBS0_SYNKA|nr:hypothetical protein SKAU_G00020530 [Synaphobranchus kaupii]